MSSPEVPAPPGGPPDRTLPGLSLGAKVLLAIASLVALTLLTAFFLLRSTPLRDPAAGAILIGRLLKVGGLLFAAFLLFGLFFARRASRDLALIDEAAIALGAGEFGAPLPTHRDDEIGRLARKLDNTRAQLRATIREVTEERNRLRAIFEAMADGVLVTDHEGRIVLMNPALHEMLGAPEQAAGRTILELVRNPDLHNLVMETLLGEIELSGEIVLRRGSVERRVVVRVVRVENPGEQPGAVAVLHDITELRRLEQMRRDFVANVSHELKTPLAAIRGYAETLAETPPGDPAHAKRFAETILRNSERLGNLVDDLLELSRIESGEVRLHPEEVSLAQCVDRVVLALEPLARRRRLTFSVAIPPSFPHLHVDTAALETVLSNLIENAFKYTPEEGRVEIRARVDGDLARIEVADSGPGIAAEHLPRLFERFYRVDPSRSREQGGTGLGLAIVKHLSQALGGRAGVESALGKGSVFYVGFPFRSVVAPSSR